MACVYIHRRKDNKEVFYIGISKRKDLKRAYSKYSRNSFWKNIVNKYDYTVEIFKFNISFSCATTLEKILIFKYGRRDLGLGTLVNLTDGGEIPINLSKESKAKMSFKGKNISLETRLKISKTNIKSLSLFEKQDVKSGKYNKRKVLKLDIQGNIICEYDSLASAYRDTKVRQGNIYKVCQGKRMIAGGYRWKYKI